MLSDNVPYVLLKRYRIAFSVIALLLLYTIIWYLSRFHFGSEFVKTDRLHVCLRDRLKPFLKKMSQFDAFLTQSDDPDSGSITLVGNGYIGCSFQYNQLLFRHSGFLSLSINIPVLISLDVHGYISGASFVLDIMDGIMYKMNCFKHEHELCISSGTMVYAHRIYPSLLVQNFLIYNPLPTDATVGIRKTNIREWEGMKTLHTVHLKQKILPDEEEPRIVTYQIISMLIEQPAQAQWNTTSMYDTSKLVYVVVLFEPTFPDNFSVVSGKTQSYSFITGVRSSAHPLLVTEADLAQFASEHGVIGRERKALEGIILAELTFALQYPESELRILHTTAWNRLWLSGLTLAYSHAPNALNGRQINTTLYYLAANTPDYFSRDNEANRTTMEFYRSRLTQHTNCSLTTNLMRSTSHWKSVRTIHELGELVSLWHQTLHDANCGGFINDGVHGMLQAALCAIGLFSHFHKDYVSVSLPTESLNRDMTFRRIQLNHPGVYVNVEVHIAPGKVSLSSPHLLVVELYVWRSRPPPPLSSLLHLHARQMGPITAQILDPQFILSIQPSQSITDVPSDLLVWIEHEASDTPIFACPAACQQLPVGVGYSKVFIPHLVTTPPSALMHLGTYDVQHLQRHSQVTKYFDVRPGPNPDHDLVTLHRHGHAFGGLPWLFWITLGLLITLFHLFFCKVIYSELIRDKSDLDAENARHMPRYHYDLRSPKAVATPALIKAELASRRRYCDMQLDSFP